VWNKAKLQQQHESREGKKEDRPNEKQKDDSAWARKRVAGKVATEAREPLKLFP